MRRLVVFIGTTSGDLSAYRHSAIQICQWLDLPPIAMERFDSAQRYDIDFCRARLLEADLYLGIYAYRYGWQPPDFAGKSILELEYEWARQKPMPRLLYLVDEKWSWPPEQVDMGDEGQKLLAFKQTLRQQDQPRNFRSLKRFRRNLAAQLKAYKSGQQTS